MQKFFPLSLLAPATVQEEIHLNFLKNTRNLDIGFKMRGFDRVMFQISFGCLFVGVFEESHIGFFSKKRHLVKRRF